LALTDLITADLAAQSPPAENRVKFESLSAFASAQLADVTGHLVAIIGHDQYVNQDLVDVLNKARKATGESQVSGQTTLTQFADAVSATNAALLMQAQSAHKRASEYWKDPSTHAQAEERALMRLIDSSRGYTRYHHARLTATNAAAFRAQCDLAIQELEDALVAQPEHYTVLQNLGRIYSDEALRASDPQFQTAIDYFKRSTVLKPNDYWGHSNLARLYGRLLESPAAAKSLLTNARQSADRALALRPDDAELFLTSARVAMWEWEWAAATERAALQTTVERLLHYGSSGDQWDVRWANAAWAIHGLRGFESNQTAKADKEREFQSSQGKAVTVIQEAIDYYGGHTTWAAHALKERLETLRDEIKTAKHERRALLTPIF
jgi:tetratricopeptide (TPR) repeat protein